MILDIHSEAAVKFLHHRNTRILLLAWGLAAWTKQLSYWDLVGVMLLMLHGVIG